MNSIAPHITAFFQQRLRIERGASDHTCESYAYAFKFRVPDPYAEIRQLIGIVFGTCFELS